MVSKLLLATEECFFKAEDTSASPVLIGELKDHYYEIKAGIGLYKSPELYGAFPTDAYSHTPGGAGAKQPGMTGQVKEDFISRMGELGVRINAGNITFDARLINKKEFFDKAVEFEYYDVKGEKQTLSLSENQLAYTLCQVPVVYTLNDHEEVIVSYTSGKKERIAGLTMVNKISKMIFNRGDEVKLVEVSIKNN
jgi:hypothetical protein